jgi:hypothetical protein
MARKSRRGSYDLSDPNDLFMVSEQVANTPFSRLDKRGRKMKKHILKNNRLGVQLY